MQNLMGYKQQAYRKVNVETANPGRILLQLYDAAIRFVENGASQIKQKQAGPKGESLAKAHAIIAEFINALDHSVSPELCSNLEQVYGFMLDQIALANINMDEKPLESVLMHLKGMRDTWKIAVDQVVLESGNSGMGRAL